MFRTICFREFMAASCLFLSLSGASLALGADEKSAGKPAEADAAKQTILDSDSWRQTMRGLEQWFSVQVIYDRQQVAQLRAEMRQKIAGMSAADLTEFEQSLQDKLAILQSPEAIETRAWAEAYLQAASESRAAEFRKRLPDVARMSAAEIAQALQNNQRERAAAIARREAFDRTRNQQVVSIRDMQRQQAEAANRAREAAAQSFNQRQANQDQTAPRRYQRYPGMLDRYWGPGWGPGWSGWGGWGW
jgi:hypothetical protein